MARRAVTRPPRPEPRKRPHGTGRLIPVWTGKVWRLRAVFPGEDGQRINAGRYDPQEEDLAHRRLDALVLERADGLAPRGGLSLRAYAETWFARREADEEHANTRSERGYFRHVEAADFIDAPLDSLTLAEIREWAAGLRHRRKTRARRRGQHYERVELEETISHQTQDHALKVLRWVLKDAVLDGHIPANPAELVRVPKPSAKHAEELAGELDYLSAEEVERLLSCELLSLEQRTVYGVAIYAGLRQGEIAALQVGDIEGELQRFHVRRSWKGPTKSRRRRRVAILPALRELLTPWLAKRRQETTGELAGGALLFPSRTRGGKARKSLYARGHDWGWFDHVENDKVCRLGAHRLAGVHRIVFHGFRDTCATHLLNGSWGHAWPLSLVSAALGHSSEQVTRERYAHVLPSALDEAAEATTRPKGTRKGPGGGNPSGSHGALRLPKPKVAGSNPAGSALESLGFSPSVPAEPGPFWVPLLQLVARIEAGEAVGEEEAAAVATAIAVPVLERAHHVAALAAGVLSAPPEERIGALRRLADAVLAGEGEGLHTEQGPGPGCARRRGDV